MAHDIVPPKNEAKDYSAAPAQIKPPLRSPLYYVLNRLQTAGRGGRVVCGRLSSDAVPAPLSTRAAR